jgi:DNA-binding LacI/PurR family transcriptional regulator
VELGHRELGYISGPDRASIGVERRAGFVDVIRSTADAKVHVYDGDFGFESGRIGAGQLLDEHPSITGIACGNDLMALGVQRALADRGMSIPRDISVSGADAMFPHLKPLLTSFSVPLFDVGYQGAKRMIAVLEDPSDDDPAQKIAPSSLCMDVELIIGGTTGPPRRRVE